MPVRGNSNFAPLEWGVHFSRPLSPIPACVFRLVCDLRHSRRSFFRPETSGHQGSRPTAHVMPPSVLVFFRRVMNSLVSKELLGDPRDNVCRTSQTRDRQRDHLAAAGALRRDRITEFVICDLKLCSFGHVASDRSGQAEAMVRLNAVLAHRFARQNVAFPPDHRHVLVRRLLDRLHGLLVQPSRSSRDKWTPP
jgi:hypothetical protein